MEQGLPRLTTELDRALWRHAREYRRRYPGRTLETSDFVARAEWRIFRGEAAALIGNIDGFARTVLGTVLVDAMRAYFAHKRGGNDRRTNEVSLAEEEEGLALPSGDDPHCLLAERETALSLALALASFKLGNERVAKRFSQAKRDRMFEAFLKRVEGYTNAEIATSLLVGTATVQEDIDFVRTYLQARLPDLAHVI